MALSVLRIGAGYDKFGLYDSTTESFIMSGLSQDELYEWKHRIESAEQNEAIKLDMNSLRERWIVLLVKGGNTEQEANTFLKSQMPFLYDSQTA